MRSNRNHLPFVLMLLGFTVVAAVQLLAVSRAASVEAAAQPLTGAEANSQKNSKPAPADDALLAKSYRFESGGWIYVHLEGSPHDVGYQHGYLLASEIGDAFAAVSLQMTHVTQRDWEFFRAAARQMLWPKIDPEYQAELKGIVDGLQARKVNLDLYDIVALNAFEELPGYYVPWVNEQTHAQNAPKINSPENCSAFVANGSWTKDHQIVMAHNNWTSYLNGERWRIIFDIVPQQGYRMLMDGFPGVIASDDDFGINSDGMMITETTISNFHGWDYNGKPEFARARKAMQYAGSIDDYVKIIMDGNNGGYANDWLLGDRKTGEIAQFEQGLQHTKLYRTMDGVFVGSNFVSDPGVMRDDTTFDPKNMASSPNARHARWDDLMNENKGKIDITMAQAFLSDHYDTYTKKAMPDHRTLCGHGDSSVDGDKTWDMPPYEPMGAVQGKVMDSKMAGNMSFVARIGHPCGAKFDAAQFLREHPEFNWQAPVMRDMEAGPWTQFRIGQADPKSISTAN